MNRIAYSASSQGSGDSSVGFMTSGKGYTACTLAFLGAELVELVVS